MNHQERVNYAEKEIEAGKTDDEIIEKIKQLNWGDFNEDTTRMYVQMVRENEAKLPKM